MAYRAGEAGVEVALISVGPQRRCQLPKGIADAGETPEATAVREGTGINAALLQEIETIGYWYVGDRDRQRVRFHKFVHFFLLRYTSGEIGQHDWEVNEAPWAPLAEVPALLSFKNERQVLEKAKALIKDVQL